MHNMMPCLKFMLFPVFFTVILFYRWGNRLKRSSDWLTLTQVVNHDVCLYECKACSCPTIKPDAETYARFIGLYHCQQEKVTCAFHAF